MKKLGLKIFLSTMGLAAIAVVGLLFIPRQYDVPEFRERAGTQYWELSTGSRIGYTLIPAQGKKRSYPIIYLHGGPGGPIYDKNIELLKPLAADGFDVFLYDQVGCGHSSRLENINEYTAERHQQDLAAIVHEIGAEKVILIGQSWGAMLACLFVSEHAERVEKIIFTGPGPVLPIRKELASITAPDSLQLRAPYYSNRQGNEQANNMRSSFMAQVAWRFGKKLASDREADQFATYLNQFLNRSTVCDTSFISQKLEPGAGFYVQVMTVSSFNEVPDQRDKIKDSHIPVLILKGQCDNQPWGYTQEYLELFPDHQLLVIPNAGHAIGIEQPARYLEAISGFLSTDSQ